MSLALKLIFCQLLMTNDMTEVDIICRDNNGDLLSADMLYRKLLAMVLNAETVPLNPAFTITDIVCEYPEFHGVFEKCLGVSIFRASISTKVDNGKCLLGYAIKFANGNKLEIVKALLAHGANPDDYSTESGYRPIHYAVVYYDDAVSLDILDVLLGAGANIYAKTNKQHLIWKIAIKHVPNKFLWKILSYLLGKMRVNQDDLVRVLIKRKPQMAVGIIGRLINFISGCKDKLHEYNRYRPNAAKILETAIHYNLDNIIKLVMILKRRESIRYIFTGHVLCLLFTCAREDVHEIIRIFLRYMDLSYDTRYIYDALVTCTDISIMKIFISYGFNIGRQFNHGTLLHRMASTQNYLMVEFLAPFIDTNCCGTEGKTVLHILVANFSKSHAASVSAAIMAVLANGCNPNEQNAAGCVALEYIFDRYLDDDFDINLQIIRTLLDYNPPIFTFRRRNIFVDAGRAVS